MQERRKGYLFGITPGEWLTAMIVAGGVVYAYGVQGETVRQNSASIAEGKSERQRIHDDFTRQLRESEVRTRQEIKDSEIRTREDIKELRQLLIKRQP